MDHKLIHFLALFSLVYFPPIPLVVIFFHKTLNFWRRIGTLSYIFFILLFALAFGVLAVWVAHYREPILSWRIYDHGLSLLGLLPLIAGFVIGVISIRTLSIRVLLGFPEIQTSHYPSKLITKGIYTYIRHPRYLEFMLEVLGIAVLSGCVWNFILFVYIVPAVWCLSAVEERELVQRFGQQYLEYRKVTGRFFPKLDS